LQLWIKQIGGGSPTYEYVSSIAFDSTASYVAVLLDKVYGGPLNVVILKAYTGSIDNNFEDKTSGIPAEFSPRSLLLDSSDMMLYIAMGYNGRFTVTKVDT
jgi:hypothetical protein